MEGKEKQNFFPENSKVKRRALICLIIQYLIRERYESIVNMPNQTS